MPFGSEQWMYASGGFYPYEIDQSLRFNDDDTAYLSRTPASAGNRKTWTWSGWVKRGKLGTFQRFFTAKETASNSESVGLRFDSSDRFDFIFIQDGSSSITGRLVTTQVFRDVSSWYHIVFAQDTTASDGDKMRLWVNGLEATQFSTETNMTTNHDGYVNETVEHRLGSESHLATQTFDGYMAEVNFIDGQALDATSFGQLKSGVWIPKSYSGTYGTNGFYLDFGNAGSLGADSSGNGNNWTPNNLAATDQVPDSPTNNFATLNSLTTEGTFSEGNLKFIGPSLWRGAPSTVKIPNDGKWYAEFLLQTNGINNTLAGTYGLVGLSSLYAGVNFTEFLNNSYLFSDTSVVSDYGSSTVKTLGSAGDVIGVSIDMSTGSASIFRNGTLLDSTTISDTEELNFVYLDYDATYGQHIANFGQDSSFAGNKTAQGNTDANGIGDFYYAPPAGYLALCTANLPNPAIDPAQDDVPADYFNTVLWTGDGTTSRDITGVGFQPDWVWYKKRSAAFDHNLFDAVRGAGKPLESSSTAAEFTSSDRLNGFVSDGFNVGNNSGVNASSATYVAWNWLAGNGTSTNTDGTITSTVSANQKAGFSIVSYTGNLSSAGTATVGHGLGVEPDMIIAKARSSSSEWIVMHRDLASWSHNLFLNLTASALDTSTYGSRSVSASTFTTNYVTGLNINGVTQIAYCFHSVEGFSKFGSYIGNGSSTDGPFVYTGFRPAFVMMKRTDSSGNWWIYDSTRNNFNVVDNYLYANTNGAELSYDTLDLLSNGFRLRLATYQPNTGGANYIYMAFAEMPFKYSNAR